MLQDKKKLTSTGPRPGDGHGRTGAARLASTLCALSLLACAHERPATPGSDEPMGAHYVGESLDPGTQDFAQPILAETAPAQSDARPACSSLSPDGRLHRGALLEVVERGLGSWLQGVRVKAQVQNGKFGGWRIESLHLANPCYAQIDLRPGDVVTSVNGKPVARDVQAFEVWTALKTAPAIEVDYQRGGQKQRLLVTIID